MTVYKCDAAPKGMPAVTVRDQSKDRCRHKFTKEGWPHGATQPATDHTRVQYNESCVPDRYQQSSEIMLNETIQMWRASKSLNSRTRPCSHLVWKLRVLLQKYRIAHTQVAAQGSPTRTQKVTGNKEGTQESAQHVAVDERHSARKMLHE